MHDVQCCGVFSSHERSWCSKGAAQRKMAYSVMPAQASHRSFAPCTDCISTDDTPRSRAEQLCRDEPQRIQPVHIAWQLRDDNARQPRKPAVDLADVLSFLLFAGVVKVS